MENNSLSNSLEGETSTLDVSHHSPRPQVTTQENTLLTSSYLQYSIDTTPIVSPLPTVGNRYTYTTPLVSPVAQFNSIDQSSTQVLRSFNLMRPKNRFVFMPTPSLPSPSINIRSTNITNLVDFGVTNHPIIRNQGPSSMIFPSCRNICIHCEICHNCPIRRWSSYLDHISLNAPFAPRIQLPYYMHHYQPLNTPINPNQSYASSANRAANLAPDIPPRACSNGVAHTKQMPTQMYKCSVCHIEFPTAQAYGGHMSSHSKARKARFGVDENWVRPKRARPLIHQSPPIDGPDDQQQSSFATDGNNYSEEFDVPHQELKKEDAFDDEEEDEELKYLIDDVANAEPLRRDLE